MELNSMDMSHWLYILPVAIAFFFIIGWKEQQPPKTTEKLKDGKVVYRSLSPEDAWARLNSTRGIVLADVRTEKEYEETHLPDSVNVPINELNPVTSSRFGKRNKTIFVYCQSGTRSKQAVKALYGFGFTDVYDIGGMAAFYKRKPE